MQGGRVAGVMMHQSRTSQLLKGALGSRQRYVARAHMHVNGREDEGTAGTCSPLLCQLLLVLQPTAW